MNVRKRFATGAVIAGPMIIVLGGMIHSWPAMIGGLAITLVGCAFVRER
jgi:branched-subunit amino acid ABC-type transport system permease component